MSMTTRPRWLMLWLLPVLALALDGFQLDLTFRFYIFVKRQGASMDVLMPLLFLVEPVITAAIFAYPLARLYGRYGVLVAAALGLLAVWHGMSIAFEESGPTKWAIWAALSLWTTAVTMFATHVCHFWLGGSELAVVPADALQEAGTVTSPRWLRLLMLPLGAVAMYHLETSLGLDLLNTLGELAGDSRSARRGALLLTSLIVAALMALTFAYPAGRLYGRRAALASLTMTTPLVAYWADYALQMAQAGRPVVVASSLVEAVGLLTLVPLAAWWVQRRLAGSRLVVVPGGSGGV
jgi:hypothetical protein